MVSMLLMGCSKWNVTPKEYYSSAARGDLDTKPYVLYDLDLGAANGSENADFYWRAIDQTSFYVSPTNGAAIVESSVPDPWNIPYLDLMNQNFKTSTITVGTYSNAIAYITNQGRYGAFRVSDYSFTNSTLKVAWITYSR